MSDVVEGPTVGPRRSGGVTPLVVEADRVVIGVCAEGRPATARLVTFRDGSVETAPWVRHDLAELDAEQAADGRSLLHRAEDRTGRPYTPASTWHVSEYGRPTTDDVRPASS